MIDIQIQPIPNQSFTFVADDTSFNVTFKTTNDRTIADFVINDDIAINGIRVMPNKPIIPYPYLEYGNFFFVSNGEIYPFYTDFGISQNLVYLTVGEMNDYRN